MSTDTTVRPAESTEPRLLTIDELAAALRSNAETIRYWRKTGYGPKGIRVGRRVLYRTTDVNAWLNHLQHEQAGES